MKKILCLLLCVAVLLSITTSTVSASMPKPCTGEYKMESYLPYLNYAQKHYESKTMPCEVDREPLTPLHSISEPRYVKQKSGIYSSQRKKNGTSTILLTGDLMSLDCQQNAAFYKYGCYDFSDSFHYLSNVFSRADYLAGNLETTLSDSAMYTAEIDRIEGKLNRNAPSTYLDAIKDAGFDFLATANNHCLDTNVKGLYETICHLDQYGISHTGTFMNYEHKDSNRYVIASIDGIKVAFLSYTEYFNARNKWLTPAGQKCLVNPYSKQAAKKDISAAKKAGAEYVIVYIHWGVEKTHAVSKDQKTVAKELANAGADFIAGSHPHVLQKYDTIKSSSGKTVHVIYSLGNFISAMRADGCRDSVILKLQLKKKKGKVKVKTVTYIPCYTYSSYNEYKWTVVPLLKKYTSKDQVLADAHSRVVRDMGSKIKETTVKYR